jgi:hypothetical protein
VKCGVVWCEICRLGTVLVSVFVDAWALGVGGELDLSWAGEVNWSKGFG